MLQYIYASTKIVHKQKKFIYMNEDDKQTNKQG